MATFKTGYYAGTGGTESLGVTTNLVSVVSSPSPPTPGGVYCFKHGWKQTAVCKTYTLSGTPWITAHCVTWFSNVSPSSACRFIHCEDGGGRCCSLQLAASPLTGKLELLDASSVVQDSTVENAIAADKWYSFDIKYKHSNSTDIEVWMSEYGKPSKKILSASSFDASSGGTVGTFYTYNGVSAGINVYTPHFVVLEDSETNMHDDPTTSRIRYYRPYQNNTQGSSGDFGGDALDSGNWSDAGETPANDSNYGVYNVTSGDPDKTGGIYTNDGARVGPSGDLVIGKFDNITGALYAVRARSADNFPLGKRVKFTMLHGSSTSHGSTAWPMAIPGAWNQNANRQVVLDNAHADCPTRSEFAAVGVEADYNTQDGALWIGEAWSLVAFERPRFATVDGLIFKAT